MRPLSRLLWLFAFGLLLAAPAHAQDDDDGDVPSEPEMATVTFYAKLTYPALEYGKIIFGMSLNGVDSSVQLGSYMGTSSGSGTLVTTPTPVRTTKLEVGRDYWVYDYAELWYYEGFIETDYPLHMYVTPEASCYKVVLLPSNDGLYHFCIEPGHCDNGTYTDLSDGIYAYGTLNFGGVGDLTLLGSIGVNMTRDSGNLGLDYDALTFGMGLGWKNTTEYTDMETGKKWKGRSNNNGWTAQWWNGETLVNISYSDSSGTFDIKFYSASSVDKNETHRNNDGSYPTSGSAYSGFEFRQSNHSLDSASNRIIVRRTIGGDEQERAGTIYQRLSDGSLQVTSGAVADSSGSDSVGGWAIPQPDSVSIQSISPQTVSLSGAATTASVLRVERHTFPKFGDAPEITVESSFTEGSPTALLGKPFQSLSATGLSQAFTHSIGTYNSASKTFTPTVSGHFHQTQTVLSNATDGMVAGRSTRTATVIDDAGRVWQESLEVFDGNGFQLLSQTDSRYVGGHLMEQTKDGRAAYTASWSFAQHSYEQDHKLWDTDAQGITTSYSDSDVPWLQQNRSVNVKLGIITERTVYSGGDWIYETTTSSDSSLVRQTIQGFQFGRIVSSTSRGLTTTYSYSTTSDSSTGAVLSNLATTYFPGGGSETRESDASGRLLWLSRSGGMTEHHTYGTDSQSHVMWERTDFYAAGDNSTQPSPNYRKIFSDQSGRVIREESPAFGSSESNVVTHEYNALGQLVRDTATGRPDRLYVYDNFGELWRTGLDLDHNGILDLGGTDPIEQTETSYVLENDGNWYLTTTHSNTAEDHSSTLTPVSITKQRMTFPSTGNLVAESISIDAAGAQAVSTTVVDRANARVTTTTTRSGATLPEIGVSEDGLLKSTQSSVQSLPTLYFYDGLGRTASTSDPRADVVTLWEYDENDRPVVITTSASATMFSRIKMDYVPDGDPGAG